MKRLKECSHCHETFAARRRNQQYCSASCRTMACYKRKGYRYVSGHYAKQEEASMQEKNPGITALQQAGRPSDEVTLAGVFENAIGSGLVAAGKHWLFDQEHYQRIKELHEELVVKRRQKQQSQQQQIKAQQPKKLNLLKPYDPRIKMPGRFPPPGPWDKNK